MWVLELERTRTRHWGYGGAGVGKLETVRMGDPGLSELGDWGQGVIGDREHGDIDKEDVT